ncbi:Peptide deformylase [Planctomycetes bacterium Pan216]|uniref:Peptide deformylase n=1 Tax=Kolteria novifilia TaxID=2527975 RepID=A0A518BCM8_9BACT|nr:Peptide deformylase [Planctomycetes bacterium Pan216]
MRIVQYPHPSLLHPAVPVTRIDKELRRQIGEMFELMYDAKGLGLAATQVALPYQLLVANVGGAETVGDKEQERVYINPVITRRKGTQEGDEGCLSFPGLYAKVRRAKEVVVEAYDLKGQKVRIEAKGLEARLWQHEIDHLDGVVFVERFGYLARLAHEREIASFESEFRKAQSLGDLPPDANLKKALRDLQQAMSG